MTPGKIFVALVLSIIVLFLIAWYSKSSNRETSPSKAIKYLAIGDSYTIGLGVPGESSWPNILTNHLKREGIDINLVANLAVSGYTVRDAIESELPAVDRIRPDFVTVLIGANDSFGQKEAEAYRQELRELLDKLRPMVLNPKNIVLITIPDYTKSPVLSHYQKEDMLKLIQKYNEIIKEEGKERNLVIADIYQVSQTMTHKADYVYDGLHPSVKSYARWEKIIFPVAFDLLKKK